MNKVRKENHISERESNGSKSTRKENIQVSTVFCL
jgi:hypothetical protein